MTEGQRYGLIGAVTVALVAFGVMLATAAMAGRHGSVASSGHPGTSSRPAGVIATSPTTLDLAPVPRGTATTLPATLRAVPTTLPPPTTTTEALPVSVGAQGAFLTPVTSRYVRNGDPVAGCAGFNDPGGWSAQCGVASNSGGDLAWVIESRGLATGSAWHVYLMRRIQGDQWLVALAVADETGSHQWTTVHAAAIDVTGDGNQDVVFGFHYAPPGSSTVIDVVSGAGQVNLHRWYLEGSVQLHVGVIDAWGAGPNGVGYGHEELRYLSGAWRIVSSVPAPPVIPPGSV